MTIRFMVRDARDEEPKFVIVTRAYYKKCATIHDRTGQPLRTGVTYEGGIPVKWLTLMEAT